MVDHGEVLSQWLEGSFMLSRNMKRTRSVGAATEGIGTMRYRTKMGTMESNWVPRGNGLGCSVGVMADLG